MPEPDPSKWSQDMADAAESAANLWRVYEALTAQGFTEEQAMEILTTMIEANSRT